MLNFKHWTGKVTIAWSVKQADKDDSLKYSRDTFICCLDTVVKYKRCLNCTAGGELLHQYPHS